MPEPTVITDNKEDKKDKPLGVEVREKTFQQILREQAVERAKANDETPAETEEQKAEKVKQAEEKKEKESQEAKAAEDATRKADEERQADLARKAADEVLKKQEDAKKQEQDKLDAAEAAKKREEDLKPVWQKDPNAAKDENGNPIPRSYDELQQESARIAEEKAYTRLKAEQAERDAEATRQSQEKAQTEAQQKAQREAAEKQIEAEIKTDLDDLYAANKLPKIKNPDDVNDLGNKEYRNLFETAQKVNTERMAKGLQPIRSLKLIYYEHYKPLAKPAGHDAPVLGNESTISKEAPDDKYIVARDRNKSITQMIKEEAARAAKKMGVRGK